MAAVRHTLRGTAHIALPIVHALSPTLKRHFPRPSGTGRDLAIATRVTTQVSEKILPAKREAGLEHSSHANFRRELSVLKLSKFDCFWALSRGQSA
jgi:hypothetical protein